MTSRPTMRSVAARARVSQRTVSNVINNYQHVAPATRQRVLEAIEELGFRPNAVAQSLRAGRSNIIALVVPKLSWPYFGEIAHRVQIEARRHGYTVLVAETQGLISEELDAVEHFGGHLVDGVIFSPIETQASDLERLDLRVPMVLVGESLRGSGLPHFEIDGLAAGTQIAKHLYEAGARSFTVVGSTTTSMTAGPGPLRLKGFVCGLTQCGIPDRAIDTVSAPWTYKGAYRAVLEHLATVDVSDAIINMNDIMAVGTIRALADLGMKVPNDVLVTGWDNTPESRYTVPALTTISPDKRTLAKNAVETLKRLIQGQTHCADPAPIPHELVVRESTGRP